MDENKLTFTRAFDRHNLNVESAIKSLDSLNDQIVQFIFTPKSLELEVENELSQQDHETLKSSMALMRRLLVDAQAKFRKMVEDNKRLAARIDGSIYAANQEVSALRMELNDTNRKLCQISDSGTYITPNNQLHMCKYLEHGDQDILRYKEGKVCNVGGRQLVVTSDDQRINNNILHEKQQQQQQQQQQLYRAMDLMELTNSGPVQHRSNQDIEEIQNLTKENSQLHEKIEKLESELKHQHADEITKLKDDNNKYEQQIKTLKSELDEMQAKKLNNNDDSKMNELKLDLIQCKQELNRAKEALHAMKADRKRLKAEKLDLLGQMKQLYSTLEDKEDELREFIRNYEQRMKESEQSLKELAQEKDESEREKWEILKRARDAAERSLSLRTDCDHKDKEIRDLRAELAKLQKATPEGASDRLRSVGGLPDVARSRNSAAEATPTIVVTDTSPTSPSIQFPATYQGSPNTSSENLRSAMAVTNSNEDVFEESPANQPSSADVKKRKKRNSVSNFSKLFGKSRSRRSIAVSDSKILEEHGDNPSSKHNILNDENYHEKLQVSNSAKNTPIIEWKANQVLAWLEIEMNMPSYGKICAENIKSGKVLIGLSNSELESALGITNHFHRRKLRLAIEEYRDPSVCKFPKASGIDFTWVAHKWVHDLGIPQYSSVFETQLMDGRLLNSLTRKDIEKYLGIHRKFHQISILHAVELLRRVEFDKEVLVERRSRCESSNTDLLVWTNQRLIQWVQEIDLQDYAGNLRESGVHGAMIVLEPTFTMETMAAALGIPPSKQYIRRHLMTELNALIKAARAALDSSKKKKVPTATLR